MIQTVLSVANNFERQQKTNFNMKLFSYERNKEQIDLTIFNG
jgi:hypothetical protein